MSRTADDQEVTQFDLIVAGMGPVGKMVALQMAQRGYSVVVVDRKEKAYPFPRAVAMDAEIGRLLQNVGLPPNQMPETMAAFDGNYDWVNRERDLIHRVDWTGIDKSGWANTYFYHQPSLELELDRELKKYSSVTLLRGHDAVTSEQDDDYVYLDVTDMHSKEPVRYRTRFALAADGANSPARNRLGIAWRDLGYFFDWLVVDVIPDESVNFPDIALQICDWQGPTTVVPGGPGRRRWEFMLMPQDDPNEIVKPENIWPKLEPFGITPENAVMERGVVYQFGSGWAESYRSGKIFLVGDAAHQMPPFAGQGLAAGFRDVQNIAWKLDLVLQDLADESLLDTYGDERINHVSEFIDFSIGLGKIICVPNEQDAMERDKAMRAAMLEADTGEKPPEPRLGDGIHAGEHGGFLSSQGRITTADVVEPTLFDDIFGAGALIVSDKAFLTELDEASRDQLQQLGITVTFRTSDPTQVVEGARGFTDPDDTYAAWFAELGAQAVLVRPDFYIFATANDAASVQQLVQRFIASVLKQ